MEMRTYEYHGKDYGDDIWTAVADAFTKESYIENYSEVIEICGIKFDDLAVLQKVDPIAFQESYDEMCDHFAKEIDEGEDGSWLGIEVIEDEEDDE